MSRPTDTTRPATGPATPLGLDPDELAQCVSCGLCLPHCPTFRVTGEETRSPRGRITAMREVELHGAPRDDAFIEIVDTCVQCLGCETACPSDVAFGHLMADTREALAADRHLGYQSWWRRLAYRALGSHRLVLAGSTALAVLQRTGLVPSRRLGLPRRIPVRRPALRSGGPGAGRLGADEVWLFTGCVMDAWQRTTHLAVQRVLWAAGVRVRLLGHGGACCGALHEHAGLTHQARWLAERVMAAAPGDAPIIVDAAGCGAMLQSYGRLLGSTAKATEAEQFAERVRDIHEYLADRLDDLPRPAARLPVRVAVQDPCHLRHVQRAHEAVRTVLRPFVAELAELDDEGLCCGAGGAYAVVEPELANDIRDRKVRAVRRTRAAVVASANPGCSIHLANAGLDVRHPIELVADALQL